VDDLLLKVNDIFKGQITWLVPVSELNSPSFSRSVFAFPVPPVYKSIRG
jgi:hypothetical protein